MMQRRILFIALFMSVQQFVCGQRAIPPMLTLPRERVNVGVKAGFNSSLYFTNRFFIGDNELQGLQNNYKVGHNVSFFVRFNLKGHHFIQPELSYGMSKGSLSINKDVQNSEFLSGNALIKSSIASLNFPLLYGYKFIDSPPYGMAFFLGPQVSWVWKKRSSNEYSGFYQQGINETMYPLNYSFVLGLAVNVSNIFFDFRYDAGLHSTTRSLTYDRAITPPPYDGMDVSIKRRKDMLNFSLGIIF